MKSTVGSHLFLIAIFFTTAGCSQVELRSRLAESQKSQQTEAKTSQLFFGGQAPELAGGPFELLGESTSHPESSTVFVGPLDNANSQLGITTHSSRTYGSVVKDLQFNLESGLIKLAQVNPDNTTDLLPPANGGNYFIYSNALNDMLKIVTDVRGGKKGPVHAAPERPELDDTIRYLNYVLSTLKDTPTDAIYFAKPTTIRVAGSYAIAVSYKAVKPRNIELQLSCNNVTLSRVAATTGRSGIGSTSMTLTVPSSLPTNCVQAQLIATTSADTEENIVGIQYSQPITIDRSDLIENIYTRARTALSEKAFWLKVVYATSADSVLKVSLLHKDDPTNTLVQQEYPISAGDHQAQEVLITPSDELRSTFTGYEIISVKIYHKDGTCVAEYTLYAGNARA